MGVLKNMKNKVQLLIIVVMVENHKHIDNYIRRRK